MRDYDFQRPPDGGGVGFPWLGGVLSEQDRIGVFGGEEEGNGVMSGSGEAGTVLLLYIISVMPFKQPLIVRPAAHAQPRPIDLACSSDHSISQSKGVAIISGYSCL
jgi:hypothetical protein